MLFCGYSTDRRIDEEDEETLRSTELLDPEVRLGVERAAEGARTSGTPFISFFTPAEMLALAREAGSREVQHVSAAMLAQLRGQDR